MEKQTKKKQENGRELKARWGSKTIELGWTGIPNILLERQQALKLDPVQLNILLVLLKHWWEKGKNPFPRKKVIAEIINRSPDTVRKHLKAMESKGLIKRVYRFRQGENQSQMSNQYDLQGLIDALQVLAEEAHKDKQQREILEARKRRGK